MRLVSTGLAEEGKRSEVDDERSVLPMRRLPKGIKLVDGREVGMRVCSKGKSRMQLGTLGGNEVIHLANDWLQGNKSSSSAGWQFGALDGQPVLGGGV